LRAGFPAHQWGMAPCEIDGKPYKEKEVACRTPKKLSSWFDWEIVLNFFVIIVDKRDKGR